MSKFIYQCADSIHVAARNDKKIIYKKFKIHKRKINVRQNWIDTERFKPYKNENKLNRILYVGRFSEEKNISLLLAALKGTNIGIDLVGDGEQMQNIIAISKENNLDINFLGRYKNDKMPDIYNKYSIYILCSKYEGNPKTCLEAMSCGRAVIGTDVPGIREIIINKKNGLLVSENAIDLLKAIKKLLLDNKLCDELGQEARKYILANNSIEKTIEKEYNIYKTIIN